MSEVLSKLIGAFLNLILCSFDVCFGEVMQWGAMHILMYITTFCVVKDDLPLIKRFITSVLKPLSLFAFHNVCVPLQSRAVTSSINQTDFSNSDVAGRKKTQPKFSVIKRAGQTLLKYTAFVFWAGPFHCECVCDPSESFMMNRCVLHEVAWTVRRSL